MPFVSSFSEIIKRSRTSRSAGTHELVLACLVTLEQYLISKLLTIYAIHSVISQVDPLSSRLRFVKRPIPYSVRLTKILDDFVARQLLERFTVFDDGNNPQTVYRLTSAGRVKGEYSTAALPSEVKEVAEEVASQAMLDDVDREVKLIESLENALTV